MNHSWESILDQYLEGQAVRADVETLRLRGGLDSGARDEIEMALRLADHLAAAARNVVPPTGAGERLRAALARAETPRKLPHWIATDAGFAADSLSISPAGSSDLEAAAHAVIEGDADSGSGPAEIRELKEFQQIEAALKDSTPISPPPPGAQNRLLQKLREHQQAPENSTDPAVARRILNHLSQRPRPTAIDTGEPDVLAATRDPDVDPPTDTPDA